MAIRHTDIPQILIERIEASHPEPALFDVGEIETWPNDVAAQLCGHLLKRTNRATSIECDGCDWLCRKPVVVRTAPGAGGTRGFILCDEVPNLGRIPVDVDRLKQFSLSIEALRKEIQTWLSSKLNRFRPLKSQDLGIIKARYGDRRVALQMDRGVLHLLIGQNHEPLVNCLKWDLGLALDLKQLLRFANRKEQGTSSKNRYTQNRDSQRKRTEQTRRRDAKIARAAKELIAKGRNQVQAAAEISRMKFITNPSSPGRPISSRRVRRIIAEKLRK